MDLPGNSRPLRNPVILCVEDDDSAYKLLRIAFREFNPSVKLHRTVDGVEALDFLHRTAEYADVPRPDLILLNLNLPRKNGVEVLTAVKANPDLYSIPVIVFTSSSLDTDCARCLALGAAKFLTKPLAYDEFVAQLRTACDSLLSA